MEILSVVRGGPFDLAGIKPGDVILEIDGRSLSGFDSEQELIDSIPEGTAGSAATWLVQRRSGGEPETIQIIRAVISEYPLFGSLEAPIPTGIEYRRERWLPPAEWRNGWDIHVVSAVPNATDLILSVTRATLPEGWPMPDPPEQGTQYFMAKVHAKYIGAGSDSLNGFDLEAVGDATKIVYEAGCGDYFLTVPDELPTVELLSGGVIEGNVCWEIDSRDATTLKMRTRETIVIEGQSYNLDLWYDLFPSSPWHTEYVPPTPVPAPTAIPAPTATPDPFRSGGSN